ncbi:MAG TPA: hypothetical protein VFY83_08385 [Anaerolineales bacterium]|nr:hypothetical protein [Anaerolineales bacterium]
MNWPYQVNSIFNPGATILPDGTTLLLCRVEDCSGHSHLCAARSANGIDNWEIDSNEQHGDVGKVVFPCGTTLVPDGDTLHIQHGAADTSIAMATGSVQAMLQWLNERG